MSKSYLRELEDRKIAKLMEIKDPAARLQAMEKAGITIGNKPPEWDYWNRKPVISQSEAICLTMNVDPRTYYKQLDSEATKRYRELYDFAQSYIADHSLRYLKPRAKTFRAVDWLEWLQKIGVRSPIEWQPIGFERNLIEVPVEEGGLCWEEAVRAAIEMRDAPDLKTPRTHEQLYSYMLANKVRFPNCCPASVQSEESVKQRVYRERVDRQLKNPLKDPRFLGTS